MGLSVCYPIFDNIELTIFADRQKTRSRNALAPFSSPNIENDLFHGGAIWVNSTLGTDYYAGLSCGVTRYVPINDFESETYFSFAGMLGVRYYLLEKFPLEVRSRVYFTNLTGEKSMFENKNQSQFYFSENIITQAELALGLAVAF